MSRLPRGLVVPLVLCLPVAACSTSAGSTDSATDTPNDRQLTVLAASSLTEVFTDLGADFQREHPGVRVRLAFDSSATLALQVTQGAPADVLATADAATMQQAVDAGATEGPGVTFARNRLVLVVPAGNPARVQRLADLDRIAGATPGPAYVVCVPTAPCGDLAARALTDAGVERPPASLEVDVKAVLAKVADDEADAGLVYATDTVAADGLVEAFPINAADPGDVETIYPAAVIADSPRPGLARLWIDYLTSRAGQAALTAAGFTLP